MTKRIGIRELTRNPSILEMFDYVEIEDKKTKKSKGLFVSPRYAGELKAYLDEKIRRQKEEALDAVMRYAGKGKIDERYTGMQGARLREQIAKDRTADG